MYKVLSIFLLLLIVRWVLYKLYAYFWKPNPKDCQAVVRVEVPQYVPREVIAVRHPIQVKTEVEYVLDDSDIKYYQNRIEEEFNERRKWYEGYSC